MESYLFNIFSTVMRISAGAVVIIPHPVHAVLAMIVSFVCASCLMMILQVEFLSLIFIVVYVGAIAVLFVFVVMLLNLNSPKTIFEGYRKEALATLTRFVLGSQMLRQNITVSWISLEKDLSSKSNDNMFLDWSNRVDSITSLQSIGQVLYTHYFIYLLEAGFILLIARIGAIVLTLKVRAHAMSKRQHVSHQLARDVQSAVMKTRVVSS